MSAFLDLMRDSSFARLEEARRARPLEELIDGREPRQARKLPETGFITFAEIKPSSPSEGSFPVHDPIELAIAYQDAGASAISVLTEPTEFGGSLQLLHSVSEAVEIPVMRKDFLVDPYQVWEARAAGADGVLAIVRIVDDGVFAAIVDAAEQADMFVLVEVFDAGDAARVSDLPDRSRLLIGVNSRDLSTLEIRSDAHEKLAADLSGTHRLIAESGLEDAGAVRAVREFGYDGVLVGSALMRAESPSDVLRSMVSAGVPAT